jgi:hypothetical protein
MPPTRQRVHVERLLGKQGRRKAMRARAAVAAMGTSRRVFAALGSIGGALIVGAPTMAVALTCRAIEGGATFTPSDIRDAPAAAVKARGSEKCDVVYRIDGQSYQLGGCDRAHVGEWSKRDGVPIGRRHGRLGLDCR